MIIYHSNKKGIFSFGSWLFDIHYYELLLFKCCCSILFQFHWNSCSFYFTHFVISLELRKDFQRPDRLSWLVEGMELLVSDSGIPDPNLPIGRCNKCHKNNLRVSKKKSERIRINPHRFDGETFRFWCQNWQWLYYAICTSMSKSKCYVQRNPKENFIYRFGGNVLVCTLELAPPLSSSSNEFDGLS